jgi:predicted AAA+ superfamily ATPase
MTVKLLAMYARRLIPPDRSFFLFGPRGTGKTTWLRQRFPAALWFDLVRDAELIRLMRDPDAFQQAVEARPRDTWVVVDEVQRHPALLNDVQDLIARHGARYRYALTGSSARRLRREQANLLAARVVNRRFFPLTADELGGDFDVDRALRWGTLPSVASESDGRARMDLLEAYVSNYIAQEIRLEAAVRRLDAFTRFLEVAALANAQVTNVTALARDAGVARPTVQGYFETLVDTLLGAWLPAWRPAARVKEVGHPKFYFFDPGVVRALAGRAREPLERAERGPLLETYIFHELRAYQDHAGCGGSFSYWGTPARSEVDFVWARGRRAVAVEVKASPRWRSEDGRALAGLLDAGVVARGFAVYEGGARLRAGSVEVLPVEIFLHALHAGDVIG